MNITKIDHVGVAVKDLARCLDVLGTRLGLQIHDVEETDPYSGLQVIDESPRPGARGSKVAFLHPKSTGGILVHFVERP